MNPFDLDQFLPDDSPYLLDNETVYKEWREWKLDSVAHVALDSLPLNNPDSSLEVIRERCHQYNFCLYQAPSGLSEQQSRDFVHLLAANLGLQVYDDHLCQDEDGISSLRVKEERAAGEYIPYTSKGIKWHTDGYYHPKDQQIRSFILHCVQPALEGGENQLLDPDLVYIHLRDKNPAYIKALMQDDVMTIPENIVNGKLLREAQTGPVFSVHPVDGYLHMRYTARTRSIEWKDTAETAVAVKALESVFTEQKQDIHFKRLSAGEGLVSNNVLHTRNSFIDAAESPRLYLRARFHDRLG